MKNPVFATQWNADIIDAQYSRWLESRDAVDATWNAFFEGFELARNGHAKSPKSISDASPEGSADGDQLAVLQARFTGAIYAYRSIGHTQARFNPLLKEHPRNPRLSLKRLGFSSSDLSKTFDTGNYLGGVRMPLDQLLQKLDRTYCASIGVEYLHIQETPQRRWLQAMMEPSENQPPYSPAQRLRILDKIIQAETFETFLHTHYVGQKRFGLEGGETLIAGLDAILELGPDLGVEEIVIGMAHRGRLNVLANVLGKSQEYIFHEFSENYIPETIHGDGDVKYHLGFDAIVQNSHGQSLILHLAANPSHLEAVNAVVEGRVRARQRILGDLDKRRRVIPLLIHGDAAFAGQGVVAEVLNFSQLPGYTTGGTVHVIINNQIGFTTNPSEARSSRYCTDVAKMIEAPIFHVNGDDPVATVWAVEMALRYRQEFGADAVVDMYCYRRHGHNESDEPAFTQPTLYVQIKDHPLISETYARQLESEGIPGATEAARLREKQEQRLATALQRTREREKNGSSALRGSTAVFQPPYSFDPVKTAVDTASLKSIARALTQLPESFKANPKIKRQLAQKWKGFEEDTGIDWAFAEALSWGSLLQEGTPVRISGQDSERGTFSQRHAVLYDIESRERFVPLMFIPNRQAILCAHNSLLSEAAVLGFDYGYSLDYPQMLCIWEAQFGDFANGAQVAIDQFLVSSESKWQRISGLVLLLPHGYEGQGPEHSSARLERFLQLCAEDNIQVCNISTPAQYFHVLRRQMRRNFRKPLIIMSPKSLLRHKACVSPVAAFTQDHFQCTLPDPTPPQSAKRIILCSGKIFYELDEFRQSAGITDTALLRIEQLYPLHANELKQRIAAHPETTDFVWCQEEPANMGAWSFLAPQLEEIIGQKARYAGRDAAASPAVGALTLHKREQAALIAEAFNHQP